MTHDDFRNLVADMRHAQKDYFRTRSTTTLDAARRLEKAVEQALEKLSDKQPRLLEE